MIRILFGRLFLCLFALVFFPGCVSELEKTDDKNMRLQITDSPIGIKARRDVLEMPSANDKRDAERNTLAILSFQQENGSWNNNPTQTGRALLDLFFLNVVASFDPVLVKAKDFILREEDGFVTFRSDSPVWGENWVALYALNLWGFDNETKIRETIHSLIENLPQWFDNDDGYTASVIMRAISAHELVQEHEIKNKLVDLLAQHQAPDGTWNLGPETSQLAVVSALLSFPQESLVVEQVKRSLPGLFTVFEGEEAVWTDPLFNKEEGRVVFLQALKLAGRLEQYFEGERERVEKELLPYRFGVYQVVAHEDEGHEVRFGDTVVKLSSHPLLLGPAVESCVAVLPPNKENRILKLGLTPNTAERLREVLKKNQTARIAVFYQDSVIAVRPLCEVLSKPNEPEQGLRLQDMDVNDSSAIKAVVGTMGQVDNAIKP